MNPHAQIRRNHWFKVPGAIALAGVVWFAFKSPSAARSAPADHPGSKLALRTVIVSGGPDIESNQYAIESNARFVQRLTAAGRSQRVLFTDGNPDSCTIATYDDFPDAPIRKAFAWIFDDESVLQTNETLHAPTLARIDGPSTRDSVLDLSKTLAASIGTDEHGLLFFAGHGSSEAPPGNLRLRNGGEESTYSLWGGRHLKVVELATALDSLPQDRPLVLVMVQCYSGGFANLIFKSGISDLPVLPRDFCGFFSTTADREAAGCTSEVNEKNYQDFTTHFFAALSGQSRDGLPIKGADYDQDGTVSMLEAFAWTNVHDESIDVPMCTSDFYLRKTMADTSLRWTNWPFSKMLASSEPWQKAILQGLAAHFGVRGEHTIRQITRMSNRASAAKNRPDDSFGSFESYPPGLNGAQVSKTFLSLEKDLKRRFPGLTSSHGSPNYARARTAALAYLGAHPADAKFLANAYDACLKAEDDADIREAMLWRFLRTCRTVVLQTELKKSGTPAQRAFFARLRKSESRNPLH